MLHRRKLMHSEPVKVPETLSEQPVKMVVGQIPSGDSTPQPGMPRRPALTPQHPHHPAPKTALCFSFYMECGVPPAFIFQTERT
jgi:hypothetical protein